MMANQNDGNSSWRKCDASQRRLDGRRVVTDPCTLSAPYKEIMCKTPRHTCKEIKNTKALKA